MRAQYKINKIESKSNKNKEPSNAQADDNFRKILASDGLTWIQYCFPNITRPGTGHEKARTSCNVKNRELPRYARQQQHCYMVVLVLTISANYQANCKLQESIFSEKQTRSSLIISITCN
jgi:hypothetical protein